MNNQNETLGLRVLSTSPSHLEGNVNVHTSISVAFTSDINPNTLTKNMVVLEDTNKIYKTIEDLKDYSKYKVVKGSISYKDKLLTYTPSEPFNVDTTYILVLNDKISDIIGNQLIQKYVTVFTTEKVASYYKCEFTSPKYGFITDSIPKFKWKNQKSPSYIFQVSKQNSFESLISEDIIEGNQTDEEMSFTPSFNGEEGIYFVRVKSENGEWSDALQFFIKPITDAVIAQEDTPEMQSYSDFFENLTEPIVIQERYPAPDSVNVSLKTNIIYIKMKGKVDESRIHLEDCYVTGETLDEDHDEYSHTNVQGTWSIVYDSYLDSTYVIFVPASLTEKEGL